MFANFCMSSVLCFIISYTHWCWPCDHYFDHIFVGHIHLEWFMAMKLVLRCLKHNSVNLMHPVEPFVKFLSCIFCAYGRLSHERRICRPSVCPSVTRRYCVNSNNSKIIRFLPSVTPRTLVFKTKFFTQGHREHPLRWLQTRLGWVKTANRKIVISQKQEDRYNNT